MLDIIPKFLHPKKKKKKACLRWRIKVSLASLYLEPGMCFMKCSFMLVWGQIGSSNGGDSLSPEVLSHLKSYKYQSVDKSFISRYILRYYVRVERNREAGRIAEWANV